MWSGAGGEMKGRRTNRQRRLEEEVRSRLREPQEEEEKCLFV